MQAQRCAEPASTTTTDSAEPASTTTTALSPHAGCAASLRSAAPCRALLALRYPYVCKFRKLSAAPFHLVGDAVCPTQPTDNPLNALVDDDWG